MGGVAWDRIRSVFHAALDRPPEERSTWLAEHCRDDAELLAEVSSLLEHALERASFLEPPSSTEPGDVFDATHASRTIGARIGPYTVVQLLGRGAMGIVYEAE